jgi:hypothetical protein
MKNIVAGVFVASSLVLSVAAQGQQPATPQGEQPTTQGQPQPPPTAQKPAIGQLGKVTIGGCIQNAPPAAPAADAALSAPAASKFDLANAKVVSGAPVGTAGSATATRYRLEGDEKTISPHLNHQVEITGTVSPAATTGAGAAAAPMLKVETVKMIAAKCP